MEGPGQGSFRTTSHTTMNNTLFVIEPYKSNGTWVFDDPCVGLEREPFVAGVPEIIDLAVRDIPNAEAGFTLLFSAHPFPGATVALEWVREEVGGHWYRAGDREGWLCPALFHYFPAPPPRIYAQPKPKAP
jgi:hypothetical protein